MSLDAWNRNDWEITKPLDVASEKMQAVSYLSDQKQVWLAV